QFEKENLAPLTIAALQRRIARKPKRHAGFHVQNLTVEQHLAAARQGEVYMVQIVAFRRSAGAPVRADLSIKDAYEVDAQPFQELQLNPGGFRVEDDTPNRARSRTGRVLEFNTARAFPTAELMLCSGGGGRVDYGALRYFHEF